MADKIKIIQRAVVIILVLIILLVGFIQFDWFWRLIYPVKFKEIISHNAREFNLDPLLVLSLVYVESKFTPDARSHKGALGLMQIMPDTAKWIADQIGTEGYQQSDLLDPETNIRYGCWYLNNLMQEFDNELVIVLAAYNAGRGNVNKWLEKDWDGRTESIHNLPFRETRLYVNKIIKVYQIYKELYPGPFISSY